jgi:hypothetical protein
VVCKACGLMQLFASMLDRQARGCSGQSGRVKSAASAFAKARADLARGQCNLKERRHRGLTRG